MADGGKILSIIVPSYNMEAYLPKCLGSLIVDDQELLRRLDVIVVNDGSKDNTSKIAHEFEVKYPGVFRVIDKANGHYGSCINAALPVAIGSFVRVLDADDSFCTTVFAEYLKRLSEMERMAPDSVDVVFSDYVRVNGAGTIIGNFTLNLCEGKSFELSEIPRHTVETLWMPSVTYRTRIFGEIGYRQAEGMPFTDQQWVFYPMSVVRAARYFPLKVYKYYIGREGQSVGALYYARNFHVIRDLTEKMIDDIPGLTAGSKGTNVEFLNRRIYARIKCVYQNYLSPPNDAFAGTEEELVRFDGKIKDKLPDMYKRLAKERYVRRFPFSAISAWRKKISGSPLPYLFFKLCLVPVAKLRCRLMMLVSKR